MAPQWCFKEFRIIVHGGTLNECRIIVHGTLSQWPRGCQLVTHGTLIEFSNIRNSLKYHWGAY
jgi:hypothetical protein